MSIRKIILVFATILAVNSFAVAQGNTPIVREPDIPPGFVGGSGEMNNFIVTTLRFPQEAIERNIHGLVVHRFVVEIDGTLSNIRSIHQSDPLLVAEARRIIDAMPPWRPAQHNGQPVRAEADVPMFFRYVPGASAPVGRPDMTRRNPDILNQPIYTIVDRMPEFATGTADMANFISRVLHYPREALQEGIQGRVLTSFVIGCDGSISNIEVVSTELPELHEEAIRVVSIMPRWTPGERNGVRVNVRVLLPIDFVIDEEPVPVFNTEEAF